MRKHKTRNRSQTPYVEGTHWLCYHRLMSLLSSQFPQEISPITNSVIIWRFLKVFQSSYVYLKLKNSLQKQNRTARKSKTQLKCVRTRIFCFSVTLHQEKDPFRNTRNTFTIHHKPELLIWWGNLKQEPVCTQWKRKTWRRDSPEQLTSTQENVTQRPSCTRKRLFLRDYETRAFLHHSWRSRAWNEAPALL